MKLDEFNTDTYVRRPFQVQAFEITQDNIAELAPHVGELCDDGGTPFIKSDKKKVGNNFKVWPGFFATVLKGHVRCYSRKSFFEQFGELNDKTSPVVEFLHGRCTLEEMILQVVPEEDFLELNEEEPVIEEAAEAPEAPVEAVAVEEGPTCEHGTSLDEECVYKNCEGGDADNEDEADKVDEFDEFDEFDEVDEPDEADEPDEVVNDVPDPESELNALDQYRMGLENVIKSQVS